MCANKPLAEKLRPTKFEDYVGQEHLIGSFGVLKKTIETNKSIPSIIFWGPPGVGKTTLAQLIAKSLDCNFYILSAINSGVKDIREVLEKASLSAAQSILFIDEIHRFSKSQQDSLLSAVEKGIITLIGATTENPSFEVISPLLSRCHVYTLKSLTNEELDIIANKAQNLLKKERNINIVFTESEALYRVSGGDARKLINAIELITNTAQTIDKSIKITNKLVIDTIQNNISQYDKNGEMHYDIISAFIKSIRGSDPNAAVYWLARMVDSGEDPLFIARRMLILASEDIGNANPNALLLANACFDATNKVGYPECRIILSQCAIYLANSAKSNSTYMAINNALDEIKKSGSLSVPLHLRNAPTQLMKSLNYGKNYMYSHDYNDNFAFQEFMPDKLTNKIFYKPGNNKHENDTKNRLKTLWHNKYNY